MDSRHLALTEIAGSKFARARARAPWKTIRLRGESSNLPVVSSRFATQIAIAERRGARASTRPLLIKNGVYAVIKMKILWNNLLILNAARCCYGTTSGRLLVISDGTKANSINRNKKLAPDYPPNFRSLAREKSKGTENISQWRARRS